LPEELNKQSTKAGVARRTLDLVRHNPRRALLIFRMANWLVLFTILMRFLSMPRALQFVSAPLRHGGRKTDEKELASAVDSLLSADVFVFRPSCWKRAAILHRYLALEGIESRINFGMRKDDDGEMRGHAWLERSGRAILETTPPDYKVTYSFPAR
jgi:hypothetical protein